MAALQKAANQFAPWKWKLDPRVVGNNVNGTIERGTIDFYRKSANRLGINMRAKFTGEARWGIWTVKTATVSLNGTTASLELDPNWNWKGAPDLVAEVIQMDVDWAPDALGKWIANGWFVPEVKKQVGDFGLVPLKDFADSAWKASHIHLKVLENPAVSVGGRPTAVLLRGPTLDGQTGDLSMNLGIDLKSWAALGSDGLPAGDNRPSPLPPLKQAGIEREATDLSIPLLFRISDLAALFQPQTFDVKGGRVRVERLELSENEGKIHARLHGDVKLPFFRWGMLAPDTTRIKLVASGRPSCDPVTGEIYLNDLALTPRSESILVELLGKGASVILKEQVSLLLPPLSGGLRNKWESTLNHEAGGFISHQVKEWAKAAPGFAPQILATKPAVRNIRVLPTRIAAETGHLVVILKASADLGIRIK